MARLDRLARAKEIAQLGATIGREFSYELLHAVSPIDDETLQQGLKQLVEAELVYQRGLRPQARYLFKHALIQDTAYQSLLKSTTAAVCISRSPRCWRNSFRETIETQPELVAHHYTEAGLIAQAIPYWQQAGQSASQRSANSEAISSPHQRARVAQDPAGHARTDPARTDTANRPGCSADSYQRLCSPGSGKSLYPGAGAVPAGGGNASALPGAVWSAVGFILYGRNYRRRVS